MNALPIFSAPIPRDVWKHELSHTNGIKFEHTQVGLAGEWEPWIEKILAMRNLGDNWDGCGALAPSDELLASAIGLAYLFRDQGVAVPTRVVPGLEGTVLMEWQCSDGLFAEVEVVRSLFAEVMLVEPGKPVRHWTLPTD